MAQFLGGIASAVTARRQDRLDRRSLQDEPDPDEAELLSFEKNCQILNVQQYTGWRRLQVEIWLLFEDQTSSVLAKWVQGCILVVIIFSTFLILLQSYGECRYVLPPSQGVPWDALASCDALSSLDAVDEEATDAASSSARSSARFSARWTTTRYSSMSSFAGSYLNTLSMRGWAFA